MQTISSRQPEGKPFPTVLYLVIWMLLFVSVNVITWQHFMSLENQIADISDANKTLRYQAEVSIRQSEILYSVIQTTNNCIASCQSKDLKCTEKCQQQVEPLGLSVDELPKVTVVENSEYILIIGIVIQLAMLLLMLVGWSIYRQLWEKYQVLEFNYQNLLESKRRDSVYRK